MSGPRILDFTPTPNPVQENLETFFTKIGKDYRDKKDRVEIGNLIGQYQQNREDANAWEDLQLGLEKSDISPTKRLETQKSLNEMKKTITERDKALNTKVNKGILTEEEKVRQKGNLIKAGWPEHAADVYLDAPPGVKQTLEREHEYLTRHGLRKPLVTVPEGVDQVTVSPSPESVAIPDASAPTGKRPVFVNEPETDINIKDAKKDVPIPEDEWPEIPEPVNTPPDQLVKWKNNNEKENSKLLKETTEKKHLLTNKDSRINIMTKINDSGKLPEGFGRLIYIDPKTGEVRPTAQLAGKINAETNVYMKNLNQYLEGIKEQLGSVVSDFDIRTFKSQLPSLLTNEQGRRLILKQMKYTTDLESTYNNALNEAIKKYGRNANYIDISKVVEDKVKTKEEDLIYKINNLVDASDYIEAMAKEPDKYKGTVLMQRPNGSYRAVDKDRVEYLKKEKKWRDF